jgi:hypothetical protein
MPDAKTMICRLYNSVLADGFIPVVNVGIGAAFKPDHVLPMQSGRWLVLVHSVHGKSLLTTSVDTQDGAIRAARNFIKRNQYAIWGDPAPFGWDAVEA